MAYNKTKLSNMYNRQEIYEQAKEAIEKNNLFFIKDVVAFIPRSRSTFYDYFPNGSDELDALKERLEQNKIKTKSSIRAKLYKSEKAAELLALYRLICTPEEHRLLNQQYIEQKQEHSVSAPITVQIDGKNIELK
ncbi:MAG TPA: hypothetical protein VFC62_03175 [Atopostipes sp.]|nr:hypothetical protein [Atopostipes sp.]